MPDGQMLPDEVSERLSYFTHSTVFGKLREYAQRGDSVPDERESLIDGMNKDDEAIWGGMEQREKDRVRAVYVPLGLCALFHIDLTLLVLQLRCSEQVRDVVGLDRSPTLHRLAQMVGL